MAAYLIEVPNLPDGWVPVAYRKLEKGEWYFAYGRVIETAVDSDSEYLVVEREWQWPEWLTSPWIACDENLNWYAFALEPKISAYGGEWVKKFGEADFIAPAFFAFTPPPCTDWRKSKRKNPRRSFAALPAYPQAGQESACVAEKLDSRMP